MEPNRILSSSILDLLFDDRNKEYGAYELRRTYSRRVIKSLLITGAIVTLVFAGTVLANSVKPGDDNPVISRVVTISAIEEDVPKPEPLPKPVEPEPQTKTQEFTPPQITDDSQVDEPLAQQDDFSDAKIDIATNDGIADKGLAIPDKIDEGKGILEQKKEEPQGPVHIVEIDAKFDGNWERFLRSNLDPEVPIDKGAPMGSYKVIIQFVVDLEGNVSDIRALTNHGYGMEQEAMRVLKKAKKWVPAVQNGHYVPAYRKQPITFVISDL